MVNTITHQPRTVTISSTACGTSVTNRRYDPTLSTTLNNGSAVTYAEGEYNSGTTTHTYYIDSISDDLVTKYAG